MNILVLATATRSGGGLTIYRQFLSYLPNYIGKNHYYIFIDPVMDTPTIDGVEYVKTETISRKERFLFDNYGLKKWCYKRTLTPDVIISFQNTGARLNCRQIVYYHQSLPLFSQKWNPLKKTERKSFFYKYIYPYFVKRTLTDKTQVVVQIPFIKRKFVKKFCFFEDNVFVMPPDIEKIDSDKIVAKEFDDDFIHMIYAAGHDPYKEHRTIIEAVHLLKERNPKLIAKLRIHFTLAETDNLVIPNLVRERGLEDQFVFEGRIPHDDLLALYKACHVALFPSTIETLGLPLNEAAAFGLPILASDLDYAHEVIGRYEGVSFFKPRDYVAWSKGIESICLNLRKYQPLRPLTSSWPRFFDLVNRVE